MMIKWRLLPMTLFTLCAIVSGAILLNTPNVHHWDGKSHAEIEKILKQRNEES